MPPADPNDHYLQNHLDGDDTTEETIADINALLDQYVKENKIDAATQFLMDVIIMLAKEKKIDAAEALRERLYEIAPMALTEILRTGEVIEEEKNKSLAPNHSQIWADLRKHLSSDEATTLFYALEEREYYSDEIIFSQGDFNKCLYFVHQGRLKVVYKQNNREILLKHIGPGKIEGTSSFFSISNCSTSLITTSPTRLGILTRNKLNELYAKSSALESKLNEYCHKAEKMAELIENKGLNRREHKRVRAEGEVVIQIFTDAGKAVGKRFKGQLLDLSLSGTSFMVKIPKKENASAILGRMIKIEIKYNTGDLQRELKQAGLVIAVNFQFLNDWSIHMRFNTPLSDRLFEEATRHLI